MIKVTNARGKQTLRLHMLMERWFLSDAECWPKIHDSLL
jgi:hypothetical protein